MPPAETPPRGWHEHNNTLVPTFSIEGFRARGEEVEGGCRAYGCRRRVWLDPHCRHDILLAPAGLSVLEHLYKCGRPDGCGFEFMKPKANQSVSLSTLVGRANVRIRVRCDGCKWFYLRRAEQMIGYLERDRRGGRHTRIHEIAPTIRGACRGCKETKWSAQLIWLRTDTAIWKVKGEQLFEEMKAE